MGAVQDRISSQSVYTRNQNEVELERQTSLLEITRRQSEIASEDQSKRLEFEKRKIEADYQVKKGQLILQFQADIRTIEADLIRTRMVTQSDFFGKFLDFMQQTLKTNDVLILQQTKLYELACHNEKLCDKLMSKAESTKILTAEDLINIGAAKVQELNLQSSEEMQSLEARLHRVIAIPDDPAILDIEGY